MQVGIRAKQATATHCSPVAPRKFKALDPIFSRRNFRYDQEELHYICSLSPIEGVPNTLVPDVTNTRPPTLWRGWVIDEKVKARLIEIAEQHHRVFYDPISGDHKGYNEDSDEDSDEECDDYFSLPNVAPENKRIDAFSTMDCAAAVVLRELSLTLPITQYVTRVAVSKPPYYAYGFVLYSNYELNVRPNNGDIERIRARLGFSGVPAWYPDGLDFQWYD